MRIPRWHRGEGEPEEHPGAGPQVVQLDERQLGELSAVFAAPRWLRDLGFAAWLLLGVALLTIGVALLLGATSAITQPVLAAFVVAAVASPIVGRLKRRRVPRAAGAAIVLLGLVALGVVVLVLVVGGITSQSGEIRSTANAAAGEAQGWLVDAGVNEEGAESTTGHVQSVTPQTISTFVSGAISGIQGLTSLALGLSFTVLSLFFLLKDGPSLRSWVDDHMGVPRPVARTISGNVILSLRRYFAGVTIVAAFNGIVVGLGALVLGVPLAGTIAVVTFVTAYIPYIGAAVSGAFAVVIALGSEGTTTAAIMLVIVILANGGLQQIVQPIAFGATLDLNPLVVLIVTIGAGALFGMVGLVLAAPLTSAARKILTDLARAREATAMAAPPVAEPAT